MKLSTIILIVCTAGIFANTGNAQSSKVSIDLNNVNIHEVFQEIEKQSDYRFFYNEDQLDLSKKVSIHAKDHQLSEVLNALFANSAIAYKVIDKYIVLVSMNSTQLTLTNAIQQKQKVTGTIVDESNGEPIPGVNVVIEGTTIGVVTDIDGRYSIEINANDAVLVYSYMGYQTIKMAVSGNAVMDIKLKQDITKLEEVVVIGYGTRQRKNVVGAVDQIQNSVLENKPSANVMQALQGASANLVIQQRSSNPNDNSININIRGVSTMNDNQPLVVIDGLIAENEALNKLNPNDIENVSVLKDAGSAAIYGSRSANGVILVTTKKGAKNNRPTVRLNTMVGIENPNVLYRPVKGYENAILKNQALINGGSSPIYSPEDIRDLKDNGDGKWFLDEILQNALQQNYNLSISGGNTNTTYMVSAGYYNQESNFVGNYGIERYNFRTNLSNEYGKLKINTSMAYNRSLQNAPNSSASTLIVDGGRIPTYYYYKMKAANGHYLVNDVLSEFNPLGILEAGGFQNKDEDNFVSSLNGEYEIVKGLKAKGLIGFDLSANHRFIRGKQVSFYSSETAVSPSSYANNTRPTEDYNEKKYTLNTQFMLDFDRTFSDIHNVNGLLGVSNESYTRQANELKKKYTDYDLGLPETETEIDPDSYNTPAQTQERSIYSLFGRLGYTYNQKYYGQFSFRYDGSSKFASDYRWGFFPSFSAGWRLSDENFMNYYKDKIGDLKIRGSYGVLGNQNVNDYSYFTTYQVYTDVYGFNNSSVSGTGFSYGNKELRWEKAKNLNIGLDATFIKGKLFASFDYFNKITSDILLAPEVPTVFGGSVANDNIGEMKNYGWELTLTYNATSSRNINQNISFNIADSRNEVTYFEGKETIGGADQMLQITREGLPLRSYFGYKTDGYFQSYEEINNSALPIGTTVAPGDVKYEDTYKDGVIDDKDRKVLGNAFPRYTFGVNYNVSWKGLELSMLIQGVGKRDMFLRGELIEPFHSNYSYVMYQHQLDYWTPTNTNARWPRLSSPGSASNNNNYQKSSSLYVLDAAYLRLKNIQLGYNLPKNLIEKVGIQSMRINVNAQNLLTFTRNKFIDPESTEFNGNMTNSGANSGRNYPTLIYFGCGLDIQF